MPFSFAEAVEHAGVEVPKRWPISAKNRSLLEHCFDRYLQTGGFPEVQTVSDELRTRILQEYLDVVLFRDVVERHAVTGTTVLRQLVRRLVRSPAATVSIHRLYNDFRSQGLPISKDSLHAYVAYLEDAYLLFLVSLHSKSEARKTVRPRKCYLIDHGLARATTCFRAEDTGHYLENIVYVELRRRGLPVGYYLTQSGFEVDFAIVAEGKPIELLQVCAHLGDAKTKERELRALREAITETGATSATVITLHEQGRLDIAGANVRIEPAWRWLLPGSGTLRNLWY